MSYDPPIKISIPTPSEMPAGTGLASTGGRGGNLRVRCSDEELDLIQEEAYILGVSLSCFSRWCAIHAAKALRKHREANLQTDSIGD